MTPPCATTAATVQSARRPRFSHGRGARRPPSTRSRLSRRVPAAEPRPTLPGRAGLDVDGRARTKATPAYRARTSRAVPEPGVVRCNRRLDVAVDLRGAGQGADQTSGSVSLGCDRHDFRDLTIAVENHHRLSAGRAPNQFARPVAKLADLDARHE